MPLSGLRRKVKTAVKVVDHIVFVATISAVVYAALLVKTAKGV